MTRYRSSLFRVQWQVSFQSFQSSMLSPGLYKISTDWIEQLQSLAQRKLKPEVKLKISRRPYWKDPLVVIGFQFQCRPMPTSPDFLFFRVSVQWQHAGNCGTWSLSTECLYPSHRTVREGKAAEKNECCSRSKNICLVRQCFASIFTQKIVKYSRHVQHIQIRLTLMRLRTLDRFFEQVCS